MRPFYRCYIAVIVTVALLMGASATEGATISFVVTPQAAPGTDVEVALQISDLVDFAAPSLGVFDLDINFDPAILAPSAVVFGDPILGDQLDLFGFGAVTAFVFGAGVVNLFELSFDTEADLNALQAGAFTLATLTFAPLAPGTSTLAVSVNALGDAAGVPLGATLVDSSVAVDVAVPEPGGLVLVGAGLGALAISRRRRAQQS